MKRFFICMLCVGSLAITRTGYAQTPAIEKAEKRLADLLAPGGSGGPTIFASKPVAWKVSESVESVTVPVKPFAGVPARLSLSPRKEVKPYAVPETRPLITYRDQPVVPQPIELPATALIRLPAVDVQTPLPIPILAQPQVDRVPLGDPAFEESLGAALRQLSPARDRPVPFTPLNLPDPFENVRTGQLRNPPEESPSPPTVPVQRPTAK